MAARARVSNASSSPTAPRSSSSGCRRGATSSCALHPTRPAGSWPSGGPGCSTGSRREWTTPSSRGGTSGTARPSSSCGISVERCWGGTAISAEASAAPFSAPSLPFTPPTPRSPRRSPTYARSRLGSACCGRERWLGGRRGTPSAPPRRPRLGAVPDLVPGDVADVIGWVHDDFTRLSGPLSTCTLSVVHSDFWLVKRRPQGWLCGVARLGRGQPRAFCIRPGLFSSAMPPTSTPPGT